MDSITLLRMELKQANDFLEGTMVDVTPEMAHWQPPGLAHSVAASYGHVVMSEDMVINALLRGQTPMYLSSWAGRTGASEVQPILDNPADYGLWTKRVQVDLPALRQYAQAVYAMADQYVASLTPDDLDKPIDLSSEGMGQTNLGWALANLVVGHVHDLMGE